jgi:P-aminobenzoate N-oxygenase AurF
MHHSIQDQLPAYKKCLLKWDTRSSVRATPLRQYHADPDSHSFSPGLIAIMDHEIVRMADEPRRRTIETQRLFSYLYFTEKLERRAVMPVCADIAENMTPLNIPHALQREASKIIIDESHHAECAVELTDQIAEVTGEMPNISGRPEFLTKLEAVEQRYHGGDRKLAMITFTAVSETLITGTLTRVPHDRSVHQVIRDVIMDHAIDEATHHACFKQVIGMMWSQLDAQQKDRIGPLYAEFIEAFLAPDLRAELGWLRAARFSPAQAAKILEETYESLDMALIYRRQANPTISMLREFGMLDHAATHDALAKRGLISLDT